MADPKLATEIDELKKEVSLLHAALQKKGMNSKGTTDIFGREFSVPVRLTHGSHPPTSTSRTTGTPPPPRMRAHRVAACHIRGKPHTSTTCTPRTPCVREPAA